MGLATAAAALFMSATQPMTLAGVAKTIAIGTGVYAAEQYMEKKVGTPPAAPIIRTPPEPTVVGAAARRDAQRRLRKAGARQASRVAPMSLAQVTAPAARPVLTGTLG